MASGKWISELNANMPLTQAARRIMEVRLGVVRNRIGPAIHEPEKDVEHVHQLRVATRRAGAALELLASAFPKKDHDSLAKRLKKIRKAAGPARDWDVFLQNVAKQKKSASETELPGYDFLEGFGHARRVDAYSQLKVAGSKKWFHGKRLVDEGLNAVTSSAAKHDSTFGNYAKPIVSNLTRQMEKAAAEDPDDFEHLHQVRIHGKQLRYAMELFASCFPAAFRERYYSAIEDLQEILGLANDSHVTIPRLEAIVESASLQMAGEWPRLRPGIEAYLEFHRRQLESQKQQFIEWRHAWNNTGLSSGFWFLLGNRERND